MIHRETCYDAWFQQLSGACGKIGSWAHRSSKAFVVQVSNGIFGPVGILFERNISWPYTRTISKDATTKSNSIPCHNVFGGQLFWCTSVSMFFSTLAKTSVPLFNRRSSRKRTRFIRASQNMHSFRCWRHCRALAFDNNSGHEEETPSISSRTLFAGKYRSFFSPFLDLSHCLQGYQGMKTAHDAAVGPLRGIDLLLSRLFLNEFREWVGLLYVDTPGYT